MKIIESFLTKNPCYTQNKKIKVKGLMLHSVGCAQPRASVFVNNWNFPAHSKSCVHAFIDGNDGNVYQTLPWDHRGWHAGGKANNTHIGVEMCEPDCIKYIRGATFTCFDIQRAREIAKRTYDSAVELFAGLCKKYDLDPLADGVVISHSEGGRRGVASNHADPEHLWRGLGLSYTMDVFRKEVKLRMGIQNIEPYKVSDEEFIWSYFLSQLGNEYGVAGLMGNLYAESGLRSNNLQNSYESLLGMDDVAYTAAVDSSVYGNFVADKAGYGLAQWTYWSRKQGLLEYAIKKKVSISDCGMQCEFLMKELSEKYGSVLFMLKNARSVKEASDAVLLQFERPADQSPSVQNRRAMYGQTFYSKYAKGIENLQNPITDAFRVRVSIPDLNIRKGPGTDFEKVGIYTGIGVFTIVETKPGIGAKSGWGRLKSGKGWICLDYTKKI